MMTFAPFARRGRARRAAVALFLLVLLGAGVPPAGAAQRVPGGFRKVARSTLARGIDYLRVGRGDAAVAHVARISASAPVVLRTVVSRNRIAGRLETTSSMCRRVRCLIAVNGDFFSSGTPVGGVIALGRMLRSPNRRRPQIAIDADGRLAVGALRWRGTVTSTDLGELELDGVNVPRRRDQIILYTRSFGRSTRTRGGVELGLRLVPGGGSVRLGQTSVLRLYRVTRGRGNLTIPPRGAVLAGHGRGALALMALWRRVRAGKASPDLLLRLESSEDVLESLAGKGVLLRDGRIRVRRGGSAFARGTHPRTVVGWNPKGDVWLVAIDGRRPGYSRGMSLRGAAVLLRRLGATEAVNLDGGGSTTFVVKGRVVNKPSGGRERPVANALVVVRETLAPAPRPGEPPRLAAPPPEASGGPAPPPATLAAPLAASRTRQSTRAAAVPVAAAALASTVALAVARAAKLAGPGRARRGAPR